MMFPLSWEILWKVEKFFLEDEKIVLKLKSFLTACSLFNSEGSANDSTDGAPGIIGKEGSDACFAFKVDASLDAEVIGEAK